MNIKQILFRTGFITIGIVVASLAIGNYTRVSVFQGDEFKQEITFQKYEKSSIVAIKDDKEHKPYKKITCDVLIIGGGAGGTSAALASSRLGARTCLLEETTWLGGMLTSAGVSAIDGHSHTVSGIFKEFIDQVSKYYNDINIPDATKKCAVSYMCFEPGVGRYVLRKMTKAEENLTIFYNSKVTEVYRTGNLVTGVKFTKSNDGKNRTYIVDAKVTVDATEFGDLMYMAKVPYDLGIDKGSTEALSTEIEDCLQPLTYVAILKDYGSDMTIEKPDGYDEDNYKCIIDNPLCKDSNSYFDKERLATYGILPKGKMMINIPSHSYGNDFDITESDFENKNRNEILEMAKDYTRGLIYFMQTELGYQNYGFSNDFLTEDHFALIPYVRESRRLRGVKRLLQDDIMPTANGRSRLESHSIAIGEYPIDLHFCKTGHGDIFQELMPYQIPYEVTIPEDIDGFMVAEKNISVSHIVNGSTRLQPVVMGVGQAVGTAAYLASSQDIQPREVNIEELQLLLLKQGVHLNFFNDVKPDDYYHTHINYLSLKGVVSGYKDFNFNPWASILRQDFNGVIRKTALTLDIDFDANLLNKDSEFITRLEAVQIIEKVFYQFGSSNELNGFVDKDISIYKDTDDIAVKILIEKNILNKNKKLFYPKKKISRANAIVMIARVLAQKNGIILD